MRPTRASQPSRSRMYLSARQRFTDACPHIPPDIKECVCVSSIGAHLLTSLCLNLSLTHTLSRFPPLSRSALALKEVPDSLPLLR